MWFTQRHSLYSQARGSVQFFPLSAMFYQPTLRSHRRDTTGAGNVEHWLSRGECERLTPSCTYNTGKNGFFPSVVSADTLPPDASLEHCLNESNGCFHSVPGKQRVLPLFSALTSPENGSQTESVSPVLGNAQLWTLKSLLLTSHYLRAADPVWSLLAGNRVTHRPQLFLSVLFFFFDMAKCKLRWGTSIHPFKALQAKGRPPLVHCCSGRC